MPSGYAGRGRVLPERRNSAHGASPARWLSGAREDRALVTVRRDFPLRDRTTLRVGGPAWGWAPFHTSADLEALADVALRHDKELVVLGGGSNVVVSDQGIDALVVTPGAAGYAFTSDGPGAVVRADAGVDWDALVEASVARGLSGLEALSGIPGQVGGAPVQNIGAYGRELSEVLLEVTVWDRRQRLLRTLSHGECAFGYRTSRFKGQDAGRFVILDVALRLSRTRPELGYADLIQRLETLHEDTDVAVRQVRDAVLAIRRKKGMVLEDPREPNHRSVGSFFTNPVVSEQVADDVQRRVGSTSRPMPRFPAAGGVKLSAAWLIENAGFEKGWGDGAVGLSTQHALAIVNRRDATAVDVIRLARRVRGAVKRLFGVVLEPEPTFLGFDIPIDQLLA